MGTEPIYGKGTKVFVKLPPTGETSDWKPIANLTDGKLSGPERQFESFVTSDTDDDYEESSPTYLKPGTCDLTMLYNASKDVHKQLWVHHTTPGGQKLEFEVRYKDAIASKDYFQGYIKTMPREFPQTGHLKSNISVVISGKITHTPADS